MYANMDLIQLTVAYWFTTSRPGCTLPTAITNVIKVRIGATLSQVIIRLHHSNSVQSAI